MKTLETIQAEIEAEKTVSQTAKNINTLCLMFIDNLIEDLDYKKIDHDICNIKELNNSLEDLLLNGATDFYNWSWSGCGLVYNHDLAKTFLTEKQQVLYFSDRINYNLLNWQAQFAEKAYKKLLHIFRINGVNFKY